jgi:hypothetical protein
MIANKGIGNRIQEIGRSAAEIPPRHKRAAGKQEIGTDTANITFQSPNLAKAYKQISLQASWQNHHELRP